MMTAQQLRSRYLSALPPWEGDQLLTYSSKKTKEFLLTYPEYRFSPLQFFRFFYCLLKFKRKTPLSYITHEKEFYGLNFLVNKNTLIPRPETELMVEEVIKLVNKFSNDDLKKTTMVDVGTGSGCIPISILKKTNRPILTYAIDISKKALKVAKANASSHQTVINFLHGNLIEPISKLPHFNGNIIITANLPYLTNEQFKNESSIQHEPKSALVSNEGGLAFYRELFEQITYHFPSDVLAQIFLEINPSQTEKILSLAHKNFSSFDAEIKKDLAGRDRLVKITIN